MKARLLALGLCLSFAANVFLLVKIRRTPDPVAPSESLRKLQAEKKELESELARVRHEVTPAAANPSPEARPAVVAAKRDTSVAVSPRLREAMRKMMKQQRDQKLGTNKQVDPEDQQEAWASLLEYWPVMLSPSKYPGKFAEFATALFDAALEDGGTPLTAEQKALVEKLGSDARAKLDEAPESPGYDRQMAEVETQREYVLAVMAGLTPEQRLAVGTNEMFKGWTAAGRDRWVAPGSAVQTIMEDWGTAFGIEPGNRGMLEGAAQIFAAEMDRIRGELDWHTPQGESNDPAIVMKRYEYRARMLKAQIEALKKIEGGFTGEAREKYLKRALNEYYPMPSNQ